jgi:hypothetical protein
MAPHLEPVLGMDGVTRTVRGHSTEGIGFTWSVLPRKAYLVRSLDSVLGFSVTDPMLVEAVSTEWSFSRREFQRAPFIGLNQFHLLKMSEVVALATSRD